MRYLLDTNTCIRYLNRRSQPVIDKMELLPPNEIAVCSVVKAEMYFGSRRSHDPATARVKQDEFLSLFELLPFDDEAADFYSQIRAELARQGMPIGPNDLMIAAIALARDLILVTHNTREFSRVSDLHLEDWEEA